MNIKEAKGYIKDTVKLYLKKDEWGDYRIPVVRQRPIFLLGAPGIGKTAIMEQIASELDIALVSYSMTHHTRQSALGLPFIKEKDYGERSFSVSEYTMSEIIASIYDTMEESGIKEGILFLDEINCVSETLYPSMLQFLQYKTFGRHTVPEGWVIVTAGNPTEFNRAVREFDVVTLDRLKLLNVEADYKAWREYAGRKGLHGAVISFLDSNREYFYKVETTADGKSYVTARGWEDLSEILCLYEEEGMKPGEGLVGQYINNDEAVREFTAYYELYNKYKESYRADELLLGRASEAIVKKAGEAPMDERLALEGLLVDKLKAELKAVMQRSAVLKKALPVIRDAKASDDAAYMIRSAGDSAGESLRVRKAAGTLTPDDRRELKALKSLYREIGKSLDDKDDKENALSDAYNARVEELKEDAKTAREHIKNLFMFNEKAFGAESNEMLVAVTELTVDKDASDFLTSFGSKEYDEYNRILMVNDREKSLRKEIEGFI